MKIKIIIIILSIFPLYPKDIILSNILKKIFKIQDNQERIKNIQFSALSTVKTFNFDNKLLKTIKSKRITIISNQNKFMTNKYIYMSINNTNLSQQNILKELKKNKREGKKSFQKSPFHSKKRNKYNFILNKANFNNKKVFKISVIPKENNKKGVIGYFYINKKNYNILFSELTLHKLPTFLKKMNIQMYYKNINNFNFPIKSNIDVEVNFLYLYKRKIIIQEEYSNYKIY